MGETNCIGACSNRRAATGHWTHFAVNVQRSALNVQRSVDASAAPDRTYPLIADPRESVGKLRPISKRG